MHGSVIHCKSKESGPLLRLGQRPVFDAGASGDVSFCFFGERVGVFNFKTAKAVTDNSHQNDGYFVESIQRRAAISIRDFLPKSIDLVELVLHKK